MAQTKGAKILEKLGDNAGNALKIVIPAAYPTAGLKTSAKTIIRNTILNYLGNIRSLLYVAFIQYKPRESHEFYSLCFIAKHDISKCSYGLGTVY